LKRDEGLREIPYLSNEALLKPVRSIQKKLETLAPMKGTNSGNKIDPLRGNIDPKFLEL